MYSFCVIYSVAFCIFVHQVNVSGFSSRKASEDDRIVFPDELMIHRTTRENRDNTEKDLENENGEFGHSRGNPKYHHNHGPYRPDSAYFAGGHNNHVPHFPEGFQHNPDFHTQHTDLVLHPEKPIPSSGITKRPSNRNEEDAPFLSDEIDSQIPVGYMQQINQYNITDLLINFVDGYEPEALSIANRFGEEDERAAVMIPEKAGCIPEKKIINLKEEFGENDRLLRYVPECTRIERCGGCCSHPLLSCQPKPNATEYVSIRIIKTRMNKRFSKDAKGAKPFKLVDKSILQLEKHTSCGCQCKVKAKDCLPNQDYVEGQCECVCKNQDEHKKCMKNKERKLWDPNSCQCLCRDPPPCTTVDPNECTCVPRPNRRQYNQENTDDGQEEDES